MSYYIFLVIISMLLNSDQIVCNEVRVCCVQTIQHTLAEIKTEVSVGRAFTDSCIQQHNEGVLDSTQASMAKYW